MVTKIAGYRRLDGRVGVRNHVVVLPVDDISNAAAENVASLIPGTLALPHAYGRLQFGQDLELLFRTLIGTGANPNVGAVVVVGIEPKWTERVANGIASTNKPVEAFSIEGSGILRTTELAARAAQKFLHIASEMQREPVNTGDLVMSIKCGESDTTTGLASCPTVAWVVDKLIDAGGTVIFGETSELTGGEHLIAERCVDDEVRKRFLKTYEDYVSMIAEQQADLLGSQPTEGNIRGGLSTIEEKALGNIAKTGTKPIVDVLEPAQTPSRPGLNFMDTSSAAAECVTLMAAAGAVVHLFPTGQGNVVGNAIEPVVKISGNPMTARTMSEHIDLDVSGILRGSLEVVGAGETLFNLMIRTANGLLTAAETLGQREFVMTKLYRSA